MMHGRLVVAARSPHERGQQSVGGREDGLQRHGRPQPPLGFHEVAGRREGQRGSKKLVEGRAGWSARAKGSRVPLTRRRPLPAPTPLDPRPRGRRGLSSTVRLIAHGASNASAYAEIAESLIPARLPIERH